MAIVLQKDMRKVDSILGRVFCNGRYYGDFAAILNDTVKDPLIPGIYSLHDSLYGDSYVDVVNRDGNTIATLGHKGSTAKLSILVGLDGLSFRASSSAFAAIKGLYELGECRLVVREPLTMR